MIEDLNKTQIILLTLLVSFVTSIGTGIITFSLLQEAPTEVTRTINQVVEKTIQQVAPESNNGTKEVTTVVVKEEDLVIDAIDKNTKAILRISDTALVDGVSQFYGNGFLVSADGLVASYLRSSLINPASTYNGTFSDGTSYSLKVAHADTNTGVVFFRIAKDAKTNISATPVKLASALPKLGQSVIAIEGDTKDIVTTGRISSYGYADEEKKQVSTLNTDITVRSQILGGPLLNLSGDIVGLRSSGDSAEVFVSVDQIKAALGRVPK